MHGSPVSESQQAARISTATTTSLLTTPGDILGVFVASTSSGTIAVLDGTTTIVGAFSPTAPNWYALPFAINTSLSIVTTGTIDCTIAYSN